MTLLYEVFSSVPAENNSAPPTGAPEAVTQVKQLNDIIRYVMASIHEIGELVTGLGTMSAQNSNNVAITGGYVNSVTMGSATLFSSCSIQAEALKGGIIPLERFPDSPGGSVGVPNALELHANTIQHLYDRIYPVGAVMLTMQDFSSVLVPFGVVATWARYNATRYLRVMTSDDYTGSAGSPQIGGSLTNTTEEAGGHNHGGDTGNTVLTVAQLPPHTHSVPSGGTTGGQSTGYRSEGSIQNSDNQVSGSTGGGASHDHSIASAADHHHLFSIQPTWIGVIAWRRIA